MLFLSQQKVNLWEALPIGEAVKLCRPVLGDAKR